MSAVSLILWTFASLLVQLAMATDQPVLDERCNGIENPFSPIQLPYSGDCSKFYKCYRGFAHVVNCPKGLHWNAASNRCDWPSEAKCDTASVSVPRSVDSEPNEIERRDGIRNIGCPATEDPYNPTQLAYPGDCTKFYKCEAGIAYPINCPQGLHWSVSLNRCDWPSVANCAWNSGSISTPAPTPIPTPTPTPTPNTNGIRNAYCPITDDPIHPTYLPYPGDCNKFYKCEAGYAYPVSCQWGMHWSVSSKRCDYPSVANCAWNSELTPTPAPISTPTPTPTPNDKNGVRNLNCPTIDDPNNPTTFPYPGDCNKFYSCHAGYAYLLSCQPNAHWSVSLKQCTSSSVANCAWNSVPTPAPNPNENTNGNVNANCPATEDPYKPTQLAYPGDCTKFYKCEGGKAYPVNCPNGLHWSVSLNRCDWPSVANCAWNSGSIPTRAPSPGPNPNENTNGNVNANCPATEDPYNPTQLAYPGDCTKFYKCEGGKAYPINCPNGLHWSVSLNRCDWPSVANCAWNSGSIPTRAPSPGPNPNENTNGNVNANCPATEDPYKPTQLAYPGDCTKFYKCEGGKAYPINCPNGLHWSVSLNRCDWPSVANCAWNSGSIPTPTPTPIPTTTPTPTPAPTPNAGGVHNAYCPARDDPNNPTLLAYPGDCNRFFKCQGGLAYPMSCQWGLHWSVSSNRCDYPSAANCAWDPSTATPTVTPATPTVTTTTLAPIPPQVDPSNVDAYCRSTINRSGYFSYPGNCKRFIQCSNGRGYIHTCPGVLQYNSKLQVCSQYCV